MIASNDYRDYLPLKVGKVVITNGAMEITHPIQVMAMLVRHASGDWGTVCEEDWLANNQALVDGSRVLSAYDVGDQKVWFITEWDRSVTTILLPSEY